MIRELVEGATSLGPVPLFRKSLQFSRADPLTGPRGLDSARQRCLKVSVAMGGEVCA